MKFPRTPIFFVFFNFSVFFSSFFESFKSDFREKLTTGPLACHTLSERKTSVCVARLFACTHNMVAEP